MRPSWMLAIAACLAAPAFADAPMSLKADAVAPPAPVGHEQGLYRFGATYNVMPSEDALSCQTACADDAVCLAWSFVSAAGDADARSKNCSVTGVRQTQTTSRRSRSRSRKSTLMGRPT